MWIEDEGEEDYSYTTSACCGQTHRLSESDAAMGVIFCSAACEALQFQDTDEEVARWGVMARSRSISGN